MNNNSQKLFTRLKVLMEILKLGPRMWTKNTDYNNARGKNQAFKSQWHC